VRRPPWPIRWTPWWQAIARAATPGDHVLCMSNGGFGGIHDKLLAALQAR
jgi:UDP-N-acetylmuramate: L-alanyl-gamma-D-glutamyl-meso-diaminopimelate ligase